MRKTVTCPRETRLGLAEQTPLVRLLYSMFGNCNAQFEDGRFRLALHREPTATEKDLLKASNVLLKLDDTDGIYWITAQTEDATLTMYMGGPEARPARHAPTPIQVLRREG